MFCVTIKVNQSAYKAELGQQYDITFNKFLLYVPNHLLKDLCMPNKSRCRS